MKTKKSTKLGLLGVLGIWITAGLALPFVNVLDMFTPPQLMVFRGFITALLTLIMLGGRFWPVDKYTVLTFIVAPFVTLGLFNGIRYWGPAPTMIIIAATPLVTLIFSIFSGRKISAVSLIGLIFLLTGVIMAQWNGTFNAIGFAWAVFATIMNGILYELWARSESSVLQKTFYAYIGMGVLGLSLSLDSSFGSSFSSLADSRIALIIFGWTLVGGLLYGIANMLAFKHLPAIEASILAQGETPAAILGAWFLLHKHLTLVQWTGVFIALLGASLIIKFLRSPVRSQRQESS